MHKDDIIAVPDSRLRQRARRIGIVDKDTLSTIEAMKAAALEWEHTRDNEIGVALAAPQIGVPERIVIVRSQPDDKTSHEFETFINPEILKYEGTLAAEPEGCLSIPDTYGVVPRYSTVRVSALDQNGQKFRIKATGFLARVLQHEIDHLHGGLFVDTVKDNAFYKITDDGTLEPLTDEEIDAARILWNS